MPILTVFDLFISSYVGRGVSSHCELQYPSKNVSKVQWKSIRSRYSSFTSPLQHYFKSIRFPAQSAVDDVP